MNKSILAFTTVSFVLFLMIYPALEAGLATAASTATVVAKQQVTSEISLTVASSTMALLPAIPGLTGGTGNASTSVNVITNNKAGYTVTVQGAATAGKTAAMVGDTTAGVIADYATTTGPITDATWADTSTNGVSQFGFGITNTSLSSANGAPGYGTCTLVDSCWMKLGTTTTRTVVNVSTYTSNLGDTFHLKFRVHLPANSNPLVPQDWYTATTTVTAIVT